MRSTIPRSDSRHVAIHAGSATRTDTRLRARHLLGLGNTLWERTLMTDKPSNLERMEEVFAFLQGQMPDTIHIENKSKIPNLTPDQAWTVLWYLGNEYWQVPDYIERCDVCGDLFDSESGGGYTENGPPYHFCDGCDHLRPHHEDCPCQDCEEDDDD